MKGTASYRKSKKGRLERRHLRIRTKVSGSAERPRLMVRKTLKHLYAIAYDDSCGNGSKTIVSVSTVRRDGDAGKGHCNIPSAKELGARTAVALKEKGVSTVVFDRGGNRYHGVVKALCDSVRENGINV